MTAFLFITGTCFLLVIALPTKNGVLKIPWPTKIMLLVNCNSKLLPNLAQSPFSATVAEFGDKFVAVSVAKVANVDRA